MIDNSIFASMVVITPLLIIGFGILYWRLRDDKKKTKEANSQ